MCFISRLTNKVRKAENYPNYPPRPANSLDPPTTADTKLFLDNRRLQLFVYSRFQKIYILPKITISKINSYFNTHNIATGITIETREGLILSFARTAYFTANQA